MALLVLLLNPLFLFHLFHAVEEFGLVELGVVFPIVATPFAYLLPASFALFVVLVARLD